MNMRKRRAILFDNEPIVLDVLKMFFEERGYEILAFREPMVCSIYGKDGDCRRLSPCADVVVTDYRMPRMSGADLLREQCRRGCRLTPMNKALIYGYADEQDVRSVSTIGARCFQKPLDFTGFFRWLDECEQRMDLSVPLDVKNREARHACAFDVCFRGQGVDGTRKASAVNMSGSGVCIRTDVFLEHRQRIAIATGAKRLPQLASVRWVRESGPGAYLVGLRFSN